MSSSTPPNRSKKQHIVDLERDSQKGQSPPTFGGATRLNMSPHVLPSSPKSTPPWSSENHPLAGPLDGDITRMSRASTPAMVGDSTLQLSPTMPGSFPTITEEEAEEPQRPTGTVYKHNYPDLHSPSHKEETLPTHVTSSLPWSSSPSPDHYRQGRSLQDQPPRPTPPRMATPLPPQASSPEPQIFKDMAIGKSRTSNPSSPLDMELAKSRTSNPSSPLVPRNISRPQLATPVRKPYQAPRPYQHSPAKSPPSPPSDTKSSSSTFFTPLPPQPPPREFTPNTTAAPATWCSTLTKTIWAHLTIRIFLFVCLVGFFFWPFIIANLLVASGSITPPHSTSTDISVYVAVEGPLYKIGEKSQEALKLVCTIDQRLCHLYEKPSEQSFYQGMMDRREHGDCKDFECPGRKPGIVVPNEIAWATCLLKYQEVQLQDFSQWKNDRAAKISWAEAAQADSRAFNEQRAPRWPVRNTQDLYEGRQVWASSPLSILPYHYPRSTPHPSLILELAILAGSPGWFTYVALRALCDLACPTHLPHLEIAARRRSVSSLIAKLDEQPQPAILALEVSYLSVVESCPSMPTGMTFSSNESYALFSGEGMKRGCSAMGRRTVDEYWQTVNTEIGAVREHLKRIGTS